jgi:hypothetical protein
MATRLNHSRALRTIGQELVKRGIDLFELRCLRAEYYLQCGDPEPPHTNLLKISFAPDEIVSLDLAAAAQRGQSFKWVDFESMPEILRALGEYVARKDGTLMRVSHAASLQPQDHVRFEYEGRDGRTQTEQLPLSAIADKAMRMYKTRLSDQAKTVETDNRGSSRAKSGR